MARNINLATPECGVSNGLELSFRAPCDCGDVSGVSIDGVTYTIVDTSGNSLMSCSGYFTKDAILTVIIDTDKQTATMLNPRVNTYTKTLGTPNDEANASATSVWARVKNIEDNFPSRAEVGNLVNSSLNTLTNNLTKSANSIVVTKANYANQATTANSATKATNDSDGRKISTTYAKTADVANTYAKKEEVENDYAKKTELDNYAKTSDLTGGTVIVQKAKSATVATNALNDEFGSSITATYARRFGAKGYTLNSGSLDNFTLDPGLYVICLFDPDESSSVPYQKHYTMMINITNSIDGYDFSSVSGDSSAEFHFTYFYRQFNGGSLDLWSGNTASSRSWTITIQRIA